MKSLVTSLVIGLWLAFLPGRLDSPQTWVTIILGVVMFTLIRMERTK